MDKCCGSKTLIFFKDEALDDSTFFIFFTSC